MSHFLRATLVALAVVGWAVMHGRPSYSEEFARFEIRGHNGAPTLCLDGQPCFAMLLFQCMLTDQEPAALRSAGVRFYSFNGNDTDFGMSLGWVGENRFDYAQCDAAMRKFAERVPDGYCIPRVLVSAPEWWLNRYPEECVRFASGADWRNNEWGGTKHESFASRRWRQEAGDALQRLVRHMLDSPYGKRLAGIHVAGGVYGEWHYWSPPDLPDTGEPMRRAFAGYVEEKYQGDLERLRRGWGDPKASFQTVAMPSREEQERGDLGMFRDPRRSRRLPRGDSGLRPACRPCSFRKIATRRSLDASRALEELSLCAK